MQVLDTVSLSHGAHLFKAGVDLDVSIDHTDGPVLPLHFGGRYIFQSLPAIPGVLPAPVSAIQAVALMMELGTGIRALADLVHPHPSITEGVQECARMLLGKSIFKSPVFGDKMQCFTWRPEQAKVIAA